MSTPEGGYYGNALQAACSGGHDKIVQMLLEHGADVNAQGGLYGNALQAACSGGHDKDRADATRARSRCQCPGWTLRQCAPGCLFWRTLQ